MARELWDDDLRRRCDLRLGAGAALPYFMTGSTITAITTGFVRGRRRC